MFGLKGMAIALGIGLLAGNVTGWRVTKAFDDSRWFKAQVAARDHRIATLNSRIKATNDAARADQARAAESESQRVQAEERAHALEDRISAGIAFDGGDADGVRELWGGDAARAQRGAAARTK